MEITEKQLEQIQDNRKRNKEAGWIYLGELEYSDVKFTPNSDITFPHYLYVKYKNGNYYYGTGGDLSSAGHYIYFASSYPMSIIGFLKMYVSHDQEFGYWSGRRVVQNTSNFKIRLMGMTEWIERDEKFAKGGSYKDMEERIESDKIKVIREKANNPKLQLKW